MGLMATKNVVGIFSRTEIHMMMKTPHFRLGTFSAPIDRYSVKSFVKKILCDSRVTLANIT
jgi:hypothetical protein